MLLFGDPVTALQFIGYGIALVGLVAYKSGGFPSSVSQYRELGHQYISSKRIIACAMLALLITLQIALRSTSKTSDEISASSTF